MTVDLRRNWRLYFC